ncbi:MAG: formylglycine-generating enzyme family protein, partial [candidate division KSB1 bacterium]|nr:formylglycine-generating enzyme family protein [candidate division KSB1 bacterium]
MAYCRWWTLTYGEQWAEGQKLNRKVLMRLPTEAEWEFAARGYEGRKYPWGHTPKPSPELANYTDSKLHQTSTVGSYPKGATPEGILDLAGNVWEWCYDWYDEKYYEQCLAEIKRTGEALLNLTGISKEGLRVLRGGSWNFGSFVLRGTNR